MSSGTASDSDKEIQLRRSDFERKLKIIFFKRVPDIPLVMAVYDLNIHLLLHEKRTKKATIITNADHSGFCDKLVISGGLTPQETEKALSIWYEIGILIDDSIVRDKSGAIERRGKWDLSETTEQTKKIERNQIA